MCIIYVYENSLRYFSLEIVVCPKKDTVLRFEEGADLLGLLRLLGQEHSLDVGEDTTLGNGDSGQKLVQLLVITDGELKMTGDDPGLLVVTGSVSCQLENLSSEVLHDGSKVHWGTTANTLAGAMIAAAYPAPAANEPAAPKKPFWKFWA